MFGNNISAVILSAGYSSRMGGKLKGVRLLAGQSFMERLACVFEQGGVERIIVVTGHEADTAGIMAQKLGVQPVYNPDFASGMFSSIKTGIRAVQERYADSPALLLCPVDATLLMPHTVSALLGLYALQAETAYRERIIIPALNGRTGHPVLIPSGHFNAILSWGESEAGNAPKGLRGYYNSILPGFKPDMDRREYLNFLHPGPDEPAPGSPKGRKPGRNYPEVRAAFSEAPIITAPMPDAGVVSDLDVAAQTEEAEDFIRLTESRSMPSLEEAWQLLCLSRLSESKMRHGILVALGSLRLGFKLMQHDIWQNLHLLVTAGLLHDLLRFEHDHACRTCEFLRDKMGWPKVAFVVGCHTVLPQEYFPRIGVESRDRKFKTVDVPAEAASDKRLADELFYAAICVYMADKYTMHDQFASISERFDGVRQWFKEKPLAITGLDERENVAEKLEKWFSGICGCTLLKTIVTPSEHPLEDELLKIIGEKYRAAVTAPDVAGL